LGADGDTTIDEFAAIPVSNFLRAIEEIWLHSESNDVDDGLPTDLVVRPSEIVKGRATSAHHVARIWSGVEVSRATKARRLDLDDTKAQSYRDAKLLALQATASTQRTPTPAVDAGETVPINEIADTTQKREIPVMSHEDYRAFYKNYKKWKHVDPKPEITPTRPQLSVLGAILRSGSCYVDMALWGNYQGRMARAMRCEGMIPGPQGTQVRADFKGPPDYAAWLQCFTVYMVAMIMMEQVLPPWLEGYIDIIAE